MPVHINAHFNFFCRTTHKDKNGRSPIVLRIALGQARRDIFSGLYCFQEDWDIENRRARRGATCASSVNDGLEAVLRSARDAFDELRFSRAMFSIEDIVGKLKGRNEKADMLSEFLDLGVARMKKRLGSEISIATFQKYRRSAQYLKEFLRQEFRSKDYPLNMIDLAFLEKYFSFLRTIKGNSHNTAHKCLQFTKSVLMPAIKSKLIKDDPFLDLKIRPKRTVRGFLNQDEIDKIASAELDSPDLDRVRDIFVFACYTGLAYIDIKQLMPFHVHDEGNGTYCIRKLRQKSGVESIIPLLKPALRILLKYSKDDDPRNFRWRVSANQKMNLRLKSIAEKAGTSKTLHMHLARHTFATTVTLTNGVPIESVSNMLGHSSIRQTQHYAKVVAEKIKKDMYRLNELYR